ncbi:hypothetical protein QL112_005595 [Xenorhabdus griffiniae]|uniref:Uncharacterized protein n=1 Tax=Xenorhabdus griffiniae TaxID=351672 RepID=A0ABY9XKP1_9GAMM|nr:hypothetical protein [Xenorhabdus griffiniae]WMV73495.1 hypothetical protein QL128_05590 [Xenorhabdus griffiniae]WNH03175.1 hypothetical protein QL112_005595 [Xenorhabdus griffiniae]
MKPLELTNLRFDRLLVISPVPEKPGRFWNCICDCGNKVQIRGTSLKSGNSTSCGCKWNDNRPTKHKMAKSNEYSIWSAMRQRCENKRNKAYPSYGGRGIRVCERWSEFKNFIQDMGRRPSKSHSLDRIDNNGNYSPDNCRWAKKLIQSNNTRTNVFITINGVSMTLSQWARMPECNVRPQTIGKRLRKGWSAEEAVFTKSGAIRESAELHAKALISLTSK